MLTCFSTKVSSRLPLSFGFSRPFLTLILPSSPFSFSCVRAMARTRKYTNSLEGILRTRLVKLFPEHYLGVDCGDIGWGVSRVWISVVGGLKLTKTGYLDDL